MKRGRRLRRRGSWGSATAAVPRRPRRSGKGPGTKAAGPHVACRSIAAAGALRAPYRQRGERRNKRHVDDGLGRLARISRCGPAGAREDVLRGGDHRGRPETTVEGSRWPAGEDVRGLHTLRDGVDPKVVPPQLGGNFRR